MHFLQKCYQNLVRNDRHCNKFAKFAILVQTCKVLVRNAKLTRISEEFCKICDSCNLGDAKIGPCHLYNPPPQVHLVGNFPPTRKQILFLNKNISLIREHYMKEILRGLPLQLFGHFRQKNTLIF